MRLKNTAHENRVCAEACGRLESTLEKSARLKKAGQVVEIRPACIVEAIVAAKRIATRKSIGKRNLLGGEDIDAKSSVVAYRIVRRALPVHAEK